MELPESRWGSMVVLLSRHESWSRMAVSYGDERAEREAESHPKDKPLTKGREKKQIKGAGTSPEGKATGSSFLGSDFHVIHFRASSASRSSMSGGLSLMSWISIKRMTPSLSITKRARSLNPSDRNTPYLLDTWP